MVTRRQSQKNHGNPDQDRDSEGRFKSDRFPTGPVVAVATAAAAAAAGAFLWSRRSGSENQDSRPLMKWGRKDQDQAQEQDAARTNRTQGTTRSARSSDTGSQTSPATGNTGFDQTSKTETKVGSVTY